MNIDNKNYISALDRLSALWDKELSTIESEEFEDLCHSLSEYEDRVYPIPSSNSISYTKLHKEKVK